MQFRLAQKNMQRSVTAEQFEYSAPQITATNGMVSTELILVTIGVRW